MATSFKTLLGTDIQNTRTKLHEAIPITGSIISGTYNPDTNIKNYSHAMFQSVYDYPYLSSSANHIFDLSVGFASGSAMSGTAADPTVCTVQSKQKIQMYNEMAQVLAGYSISGTIQNFDEDGTVTGGAADKKIQDAIFVNFARLLTKDEIQKGTFYMDIGVNPSGSAGDRNGSPQPAGARQDYIIRISDVSGSNNFKVNSPAGEYNILYATSSTTFATYRSTAGGASALAPELAGIGANGSGSGPAHGTPVGLLYYQAGIAVLTGGIFLPYVSGGILNDDIWGGNPVLPASAKWGPNRDSNLPPYVALTSGSHHNATSITGSYISSSISGTCNSIRERTQDIYYTNTTELNSTIYFCRANANEYNYSSNPTYVSASKMRVKEVASDEPVSYITTVGLYGPDNEMMAVAKLSEPLKKTPTNEFTLRVRLDY
jgi:hypothetical protein